MIGNAQYQIILHDWFAVNAHLNRTTGYSLDPYSPTVEQDYALYDYKPYVAPPYNPDTERLGEIVDTGEGTTRVVIQRTLEERLAEWESIKADISEQRRIQFQNEADPIKFEAEEEAARYGIPLNLSAWLAKKDTIRAALPYPEEPK